MPPQTPNVDADLGDVQGSDADLGDVAGEAGLPPPPPPPEAGSSRPGLLQRGVQFLATQGPEFARGVGETIQSVAINPYGATQAVRPPIDLQHPPPAPWQQWNVPKSPGEFAQRLFGPWKDEATQFLDELTGVTEAREGKTARGWGKFSANLALLLWGGGEEARGRAAGEIRRTARIPTEQERTIYDQVRNADPQTLPASVQRFLAGDRLVGQQAYSDLQNWAQAAAPSRTALLQRGGRMAMGVSGRQMKRRVAEVVEANRKVEAANVKAAQRAERVNRERQARYNEQVEAADKENLRQQMDAEEKNAQAKSDYEEAVANIEKIRKDAEEAATRHGQLSQTHLDEGGELVGQISAAEKRVTGELNQAYRKIEQTVGDASLPIDALTRAVETAEQTKLAGTEPENIRQFRSILRQSRSSGQLEAARSFVMDSPMFQGRAYTELGPEARGLADQMTAEEMQRRGVQAESTDISFRDLRGYVSELDKVLREQGGKGPYKLNGDVQQALKSVLSKAREMTLTLANRAGVGDDLIATNRRYGQYIRTFHTPAGKFGSPLAKTIEALKRAPDVPDYAIDPLGKVERVGEIRKMLQNFAPESVPLFDRFVETNRELGAIGKAPKVPTEEETAAKIAAVKPPKVTAVEEAKPPQPPKIARPKLAETEKIGPAEFRGLQEQGYDERIKAIEKWGAWAIPLIGIHVLEALVGGDIGAALERAKAIPAYMMSQQMFLAMVDSEPVRNFVMRFTADDAKIMETIPPEYRREAADNLGRVIDTVRKNPNRYAQKWGTGGKPVNLSPALMAFVNLYRTREQKNRQQIMDQGRDLTATPFQQQQR